MDSFVRMEKGVVVEKQRIIAGFKPCAGTPLRPQIENYLRDLIKNNHLSAGTKLPTTAELVTAWKTHPPIVQAAMNALVKDRLIVRAKHYGTFVGQQRILKCVATYFNEDCLHGPDTFVGGLLHLVVSRLARKQIRIDPWIDHRPLAQRGRPWPALQEAAERRDIQAMIVLAANSAEMRWLTKLPVPASCITSNPIRNRVVIDIASAFPAAMAELFQQGCRSVQLITATPRNFENLVSTFEKVAAAHGLAAAEPRYHTKRNPLPVPEMEKFGFESFHAIWNHEPRPDAIFVFPDVAAKGVLAAILQRHIRVPEDLKLVLHRNAELGLFCPVLAHFIELSVDQVAQSLVEQAESLTAGESDVTKVVRTTFITSEAGIVSEANAAAIVAA